MVQSSHSGGNDFVVVVTRLVEVDTDEAVVDGSCSKEVGASPASDDPLWEQPAATPKTIIVAIPT